MIDHSQLNSSTSNTSILCCLCCTICCQKTKRMFYCGVLAALLTIFSIQVFGNGAMIRESGPRGPPPFGVVRTIDDQRLHSTTMDTSPDSGSNEDSITTEPNTNSSRMATAAEGEDNSCRCSLLPVNGGNDVIRTAFRSLETKLELVEQSVNLNVLNLTNQQSSTVYSLLNDTFGLKNGISVIQEELRRFKRSQQLLDSRLMSSEESLKVLKQTHVEEDEFKARTNENLDNLIKITNSLWPDVMNLRDEMYVLKNRMDNSANLSGLAGELSALKDISQQVDELTAKVQELASTSRQKIPPASVRPTDCDDIAAAANLMSGVYDIWPLGSSSSVQIYCRIVDGKGWAVIQRRNDGLTSFQRSWSDYEFGFGSLYGDFWLGNHYINLLTRQATYQLKITMVDWENNVQTVYYNRFFVEGREEKYRLNIGRVVGDSGLEDPMAYHNGMKFSTYDDDNDSSSFDNCASKYNSGWWFSYCLKANLNGRYSKADGRYRTHQYHDGIVWLDGKSSANGQFVPAIKVATMEISRLDDDLTNKILP